MKKLLMIMLTVIALGSGLFGRTLLNVRAEEEQVLGNALYYTSIQIKHGDNLWSVASRYAHGSGYSIHEYMDELRRINKLCNEQIRSGEYLTVMYVSQ